MPTSSDPPWLVRKGPTHPSRLGTSPPSRTYRPLIPIEKCVMQAATYIWYLLHHADDDAHAEIWGREMPLRPKEKEP
jgi:hypothetical protein